MKSYPKYLKRKFKKYALVVRRHNHVHDGMNVNKNIHKA